MHEFRNLLTCTCSEEGETPIDFIWRKGTPFEAMTGHAIKCPQRFPNWGFPGFPHRKVMPGNLLHCPQCHPHSIITLIILPSATD